MRRVQRTSRWWGPADAITALRAVLTAVLAVLVVRSFGHDVPVALVVSLASFALVTDAVDGQVARRTGTVSRFGARFDMETDAALLLVLSTYVARDLGLWVLAIGLARYVFLAAKVPLPWLRGQAPPRPWCKVVAALQGVVLVAAASGLLPDAVATGALLVALALLTESFAHEAWDVWRLRRPHRAQPWVTRLTGLLACLVVWAVLVAPDEIGALSPAAFARIPLEGVVLVGLVLLLPTRPAAWLASGAGLALGALTVLKLLDLGVSVAFARRFDPLGDPVYVGAGVSFLRDALGTANAYTVTVLAVLLMLAVLVVGPVRRAPRGRARPRPPPGGRPRRARAGAGVDRLRTDRGAGRPGRACRGHDGGRPGLHPRDGGTRAAARARRPRRRDRRRRLRRRAAVAAAEGAARQGRAARLRGELRPRRAGGPAHLRATCATASTRTADGSRPRATARAAPT